MLSLLCLEILVAEFTLLGHLQQKVPKRKSPHDTQKSVVVPMKMLFKDEKSKSETIDILSELCKDAVLTGTPQVRK